MLNYSTLKVGDKVAIARQGSWSIYSEGVYTVIKVDKVKVVVKRDDDGIERVFSVKRRCEMNAANSYQHRYLESVEDMQAQEAQYKKKNDISRAWKNIEIASKSKNLGDLRIAVANLEDLLK